MLAPALSTPLLKIPILVPDAILTYISLTPPTAPPSADERKKFAYSDYFSDNYQSALIGLMAAETTTILAQRFPSRLSTRLLSLLAPTRPLALTPTPRFLLTGALVLAAGLLRLWTYRTLGRFFRWQLSLVDGHRLVTAGPYAWVRHPSYVASALVSYGNLVLLSGQGSYFAERGLGRTKLGKAVAGVIAGYLLYIHASLIVTRVDKEDAVLREQFGEEWEAWARRTPYKLVPYVY
ncbi:uncharacterized protein TRAVEDRAFT_110615 [Trametes versicolor FP-101664 SS1]|uniref:uncharacterized protein n=1 Tax=Trametes versicolor (strain FP-101664) TaxID=717944 RepID=UPI0004622EAD|nr:uncharacterized protein TRAVEDRAFT_110615 [Trametes versicolor FP-101664 SS1]EIW64000.1 hypothetical protein TRAVEDRAFT_110615 [Trametes versicolor FP-101664 SS1]